jgi:hypothetical protein
MTKVGERLAALLLELAGKRRGRLYDKKMEVKKNGKPAADKSGQGTRAQIPGSYGDSGAQVHKE